MLTAEQIRTRSKGIFGSDASAIEGVNPYNGVRHLYQIKSGIIKDDFIGNWVTEHGHIMEPSLRGKYYTEFTGMVAEEIKETMFHPEYDFIGGHLDGKVKGRDIGVECKTVGPRLEYLWGPSGSDEIPDYYRSQIKHYALVTGIKEWHLILHMNASCEKRIYYIHFSKGELDALLQKELAFWECVTKGIEPEHDITVDGYNSVRRKHRYVKPGSQKKLDPKGSKILKGVLEAKEKAKHWAEELIKHKSNFISWLGDHEEAVDKDGVAQVTAKINRHGSRTWRF